MRALLVTAKLLQHWGLGCGSAAPDVPMVLHQGIPSARSQVENTKPSTAPEHPWL